MIKFKQYLLESSTKKLDPGAPNSEIAKVTQKQKQEKLDFKDRQYNERERARRLDYDKVKIQRKEKKAKGDL